MGSPSDVGAEDVGEVDEERASLQAAGDRGGEELLDRALTLVGLAAVGELAVDDGAAQAAYSTVTSARNAESTRSVQSSDGVARMTPRHGRSSG
jgi:hypothetical protein